jgi:hypothetical protein
VRVLQILTLGFASVLVLHASAAADPIVYEFDSGNFSYGIMPDLDAGGTISLAGPVAIFPNLSSPSSFVSQPINEDFSFEIRYYGSGGPPQDYTAFNRGSPLYGLVVTAHLSGSADFDPNASYGDRVGGGFNAAVTSVAVDPALAMLGQPADLPQPLLDLLNHPERIHLTSPWQLGRPGFVPQIDLTIDPASSIPEPSTLVVLSFGLGALTLRRAWKRVH